MIAPAHLRPTARPLRTPVPLALLLVVVLLLTTLPMRRPAPVAPSVPAASGVAPATASVLPSNPFAADPPPAPAVFSWPELVARREEFARHYDLGGGRYLALVSPTPLNYRDASGAWQPIDARFAPLDGGWAVRHNSLRSTLAARGTALHLEAGGAAIGWQPHMLAASGTALAELVVLATPLEPVQAAPGQLEQNGTTLRYPNAWSDDALTERFHSMPGALEQELVLDRPPRAVAGAEWLELRVHLALPPGAQLVADGAARSGDFSTGGPLELRSPNGAPLLALAPPVAYEQGLGGARVAGRYHIVQQPDGVELRVQTPWAWWADPARHYPAVLDPTMQVIRQQESAFVLVKKNQANADVAQYPCVGFYSDSKKGETGYVRGYVRFPLPSLPNGAAPAGATFVAVPDSTLTQNNTYGKFQDKYGERVTRLQTTAWRTPADWSNLLSISSIPANSFPAMDMPAPPATIKQPETVSQKSYPASTWDVSSIVQGWYADPTTNHGLALTALYEDKYQDNQFPDGNYRTVDCFPNAPTWSNLDPVLANPANPTADGPGLGLLISYNAPVLQANELRRFITVPAAQPERTFRDQYHEYALPAPAANWRLVAAQGVDSPNTPRTPLSLIGGSNDLLATSDGGTPAPGLFLTAPLQFLMLDGRQGLPNDLRVRVQPDNQPGPNHNVRTYDLQTADAQPSPSIPAPSGNTPGSATISLSLANALLLGQELSLRRDTTVEIKARYADLGLDPTSAQLFNLQIVHPGPRYASRFNGAAELVRGPDAYEIEFSRNQDGISLLVLSSNIGPTNRSGQVQVTVCANNDQVVRYPLNGACVELRRPPSGFTSDPARYKTVGNLQVYSPGGFTDNNNGTFTTNENDTSGGSPVPVMPLLGFTGNNTRWVAIKGGTLTLDTNTQQVTTSADARLVLADFSSATAIVSLPVLRGQFQAGQNGALAAISPPNQTFLLVNNPLDDTNGWTYEVLLPGGQLHARGPLNRGIEPTLNQPVNFQFNAEWMIDASGGPSLQGQVRLNTLSLAPFNIGTLLLAPPAPAANAGYGIEFDPRDALPSNPAALPRFQQIRISGATLAQPPNLGGARVLAQALLLLRGQSVLDEQGKQVELQCASDNTCFDLRGPNDAMTGNGPRIDRNYTMPDLIVQDSANTVMFNTADRLEVFSTDHPMAKVFPQAKADDTTFNYEAFNATVKTFLKPCPGGRDPLNPDQQAPPGPKTTVVEGKATMTLPNLGTKDAKLDAKDAPKIEASFILCETALRELSFTFDTGDATAIPIGASGLFMNLIGGTISIAPKQPNQPGYTTVTLKVAFRGITAPAATSILFVRGIVTIDSRGLFDVQLHAGIKIAANIGAGMDGHFWVAWSPLDLGFMVQACVPYSGFDPKKYPGIKPDPNNPDANLCKGNELFFGMLRAHMWQGQGWQHRYPYLPDDDALHVAARFEAKLQIPAGIIFDWGLVKLPPFSISLSIKLAFGEFCRNAGCTQYEWGIMGAVGIFGFEIGIYYGFQSGINFILGNAGYKLIDEAKASSAAFASGMATQAASPTDTTVSLPAGLASALFAIGWSGGKPSFTLVDPNNRTITEQSNFPDVTVTVVQNPVVNEVLLAISNPPPGTWRIQVGNLADDTHYRVVQLANRRGPALSLSLPQNLAPGAVNVPISWTSDVSGPGIARFSLYYERTEPTNLSGETEEGPIVEHLPLTASGTYTWNRAGLKSGIYRVYARIENNAPLLLNSCGNAPYNPNPVQQGVCGTMLNATLALPTAQIDAPGQLAYDDTMPPAPPQGVRARAEGPSSVVVRWKLNTERDLAGYIVDCQQASGIQRRVRIYAQLDATAGISETAQVNGLDAIPATCSVLAYDASGNVSLPSAFATATPSGDTPLLPAAVQQINVNVQNSSNSVAIYWGAVDQADGYLVYYQPLLSQQNSAQAVRAASAPPPGPGSSYRAAQGPSPINTGTTTRITLSGLAGGVTYQAWVRAYDADGRLGPPGGLVQFVAPDQTLIYLPLVRR